jgi:hypothetical protein
MIYIFLFIIFLFIIQHYSYNLQGYLNYTDTNHKGVETNCPQQHANKYYELASKNKLINFFGKYSSEFSNIETDGRIDDINPDLAGGVKDSIFQKRHSFDIQKLEQKFHNTQNIKNLSLENDKSAPQLLQPFGYTRNELLHMTRFADTKNEPLPTDPDFFKHI